MERIVLAYSGGLDTSIAIPWLREHHHLEVVAVTMDLGQGRELEEVRDRALAAGALRAHVLDLKEEFARDYVLPALKADAFCEDRQPLARALGRALVAQKLVEIARIEHATAVAHGSTGNRPDELRLDLMAQALDPALRILAPAREWRMTRPEQISYAAKHRIPLPATLDCPYPTDGNLWGRSIECGLVEDPWREPPREIYTLTKAAAECPDEAAYVELAFAQGVPVAINGVSMPLTDLIGSLNTIAGAHGVGRIDRVENRVAGIKSREIYEAPAAIVLHAAHQELQQLVTSRDLERFSRTVSLEYADVIHNGLWFTPLRLALDAFVESVQNRVTGTVRVKLLKGDFTIVSRQSPGAPGERTPATDNALDHPAAADAISVSGVSLEAAARQAPGPGVQKLRVAK